MKKYVRSLSIYFIIFLTILFLVIATKMTEVPSTNNPLTYSALLQKIEESTISKIEIIRDTDTSNAGKARVHMPDDTIEVVEIPAMDVFVGILQNAFYEYGLDITTLPTARTSWLISIIPPVIIMIISIFLLMFIFQQMQGGAGGNRVMSFGKSKARVSVDDKRKITFDLVAGLEEEKAELEEIVEFLKQPKKFVDIGARIPKGVLLVGPPGTGKTYLAKAVAGEAGVPFFSISGSDFVEMFVGVGASRVRDLFEQAKKNSPCIVFIDEIDAVGRRRGAGLGGGHDEREQTLNQLLVEMDGFGINEGVIVIAATNRQDILDPALLRPGRFDRRIMVSRPDMKGREEVLKIHAKGKILAKDADLKVVAQTTTGFTPADLENLLNEAALLAARNNKKEIDMEELRKAYIKVVAGTEKKSHVITPKDRRLTAYHEAGHAIMFEMLSEMDPTYIVSVIPTISSDMSAGGYNISHPSEDKSYYTKKFLEQRITTSLGGRAAEEIVLEDISTGASSDIRHATALARDMVMKFGMSEALGPILFGDDNDEVFIGRDLAHARNYSERVASLIDTEIRRIIEESYQEALRLINEHIDVLHKIAGLLIEKEKITGTEIRKLFPAGTTKTDIQKGMMTDTEHEQEEEIKNAKPDAEAEIKPVSEDKNDTE